MRMDQGKALRVNIREIHVENFLGIRYIAINVDRPIVLVGGSNFSGKTSLRHAISAALTGNPVRVALKKQSGMLVHEGAKVARIRLVVDNSTINVTITAEGIQRTEASAPDSAAMRYVIDPQRFAALTPSERRQYLFTLMGLSLTPDFIRERLISRGCDSAKVDEILPVLRAGIEAAAKEASQRVTEARGAWRGVTGENYGEKKAENWQAESGDWKPSNLAAMQEMCVRLEQNERALGESQRKLGVVEHEQKQADERLAKIASLRAKARTHAKLSDAANLAEELLRDAQIMLDKARAHEVPCPSCGTMLLSLPAREAGGPPVLLPGGDEKATPSPTIEGLEADLKLREEKLVATRKDLEEADRAARELHRLEDEKATKTPEALAHEITEIQQRIETLKLSIDKDRRQYTAFRGMLDLFEGANTRTKIAAKHHADVLAWHRIATALGPDDEGIPAEMLRECLDPLNKRLRQSAEDTGWMEVQVTKDMAILANERPYTLLSDSEQWRADAQLAEAIAHLSGDRILILDRFDVLGDAGRSEALGWLDILAREGEIDTAIVLGTLRTISPSLPETIQPVWLVNGEVGRLQERAA